MGTTEHCKEGCGAVPWGVLVNCWCTLVNNEGVLVSHGVA